MILDSITLQNIRSHKNTTVHFPQNGITLFKGDIGSGKSTILMGIEFALFGLGGSFKGESLLAKNADSGEVVLTFCVGDVKYEVGRTLKRDRTNVTQSSKGTYFKVNDVLEPLAPKQLKTRILDVLGLNEPSSTNSKSRIYRYAISTPQDEMKSILWDSAKRLETIRKIFRMEDYQIAKQNTADITNVLKQKLAGFAAKFEKISYLESDLAQANKTIQEIATTIKTKSKLEQDYLKQEQDVKSDEARYELRITEKNNLNTRHVSIQSKLEGENNMQKRHQLTIRSNKDRVQSLEDDLNTIKPGPKPTDKSLDQINTEIVKFTKLNENMVAIGSQITFTNKQITELKAKISGHNSNTAILKTQLNQYTSELDSARTQLNNTIQTYEGAKSSKIKIESEMDTIRQSISNLQTLGAKCILCGHILTKEHLAQQASERQEKLDALCSKLDVQNGIYHTQSDKIKELEMQCSQLQTMIDSLDAVIPDAEKYQSLLSDVATLQDKAKKLDHQNIMPKEPGFAYSQTQQSPVEYLSALKDALSEHESAQKRISAIKDEAERLTEQNQELEKEIDSSIKRASDFESELGQISVQLESYSKDDKAISEIKHRRDSIQELLRQIRDTLSTCKANYENENKRIIQLESDIKDAKYWQKLHKKYSAYVDWLGGFFTLNLASIEKNILLSVQNEFNDSYREWYCQLVDDATKDSRIDENFEPIIEQDGFTQQVAYLSGGEKTSVALAFRLALNFVMRRITSGLEFNLLILDEPTDGMSNHQLANVKALLERLKSKQIILVSHDNVLTEQMDYIFSVTKHSGVTTVSSEK